MKLITFYNAIAIVFLTIFFVWLSGCVTNSGTEVKTYHREQPDKIYERYFIKLPDTLKHGTYKSFYLTGECFEESIYQKGKLNGQRVLYHKNGKPMVKENHRNGVFHGLYQTFYENGILDVEGYYIDGKMQNQWRRHYPDGSLMEIVSFINNLENGSFTEFYPNGQMKAKGNYLNGDAEHGLLELFDSTGILYKKMNCTEGICHTIWEKEKAK